MPLETLHPKPLGEQPRAVRRQQMMVLLGNIGLLASGMCLGLPTITLDQLTDPNEHVCLNETQVSWFASINALSCPLGGLLSAMLLDRLGRKLSLYAVNLFSLAGWALMALAVSPDPQVVYIQLLVSRFLSGIAMGMSSAPAGVYSAEISTAKIRGRLILGTSISIAAGIMIIYMIGYFIPNDWRLIAIILCAFQVLSMLCIIPMPESPSWLLSKGRVSEAKKSLNYFRGLNKDPEVKEPEVLAEFNLLRKTIQLGTETIRVPFSRSLRLPEVYKPLLILMGLFSFQQLTGIFVVVVYAVQISEEAGVSINPVICAVLIGVGRLVTTCPLSILLERWGRRRAGIVSALGMSATMLLLACHGWCEWLQRVPYLPVVCIVGFIVLSTIGIYTLPFFMISELFPQKVRGPASGLTVAVGMFVAFLCIKTYLSFKEMVGNQCSFLFFGVMSFLTVIYVYMVLPETRGRTLLEIEEQFRNGRQRSNGGQPAEEEMQQVFTSR